MSKRIEFVKRKNLEENLKKYNAFSVNGYYPLFSDIETAEIVSPLTSYHIHEFEGVEYYMPEGLEMGKTQFHGDYTEIQYFNEIKIIDSKLQFGTSKAKEDSGYSEIRNFWTTTTDIDVESSKMLLRKWKPCPPPYYQNSPFPPPNNPNLPPGCYTSQTIGQMYGLPGISSPLYQLWAQGNAFYDEACNQLGVAQIQPGEVVWLKNYACWIPENPELPGECGYHNWCLEYLGKQATNMHVELQLLTQPSFFGKYSDCEKCKHTLNLQPGQPPVTTSWNCVQIGDHPKFGFECVEIVGTGGAYPTKQQCVQSGCEGLQPPGGPTTNVVTPTTLLSPTQPITTNQEEVIEEVYIPPTASRTGGSGGY